MMLMVPSGRAEQVGRRRRLAAQSGELLLAGQGQLGRGQRVGALPRLLGDAPGEDGDQHGRHGERRPAAEAVERRQGQAVRRARAAAGGNRQHGDAEQGQRR